MKKYFKFYVERITSCITFVPETITNKLLKQNKMNLTITKEKVLETAKLGTIANDIMRKLFPECFNPKFNLTDRVRVRDGSNNKDVKTGKRRHGVDPLFQNNIAVVIENNLHIDTYSDCSSQKNDGLAWQFSDIMLLFPDGTKIYTNSSLCDKA